MALYAFDGTWNEDQEDDLNETNVRKFLMEYDGANFDDNYIEGVGTRFGAVGRVLGGVFGAGGKTRIEEMYEKLISNWNAGDHEIDIIGFSRGAALAVHFANLVAKHGVQDDDNNIHEMPDIRFLGIWDIVGSFGMPINFILNFHDINVGYDINSADTKIKNCFHAMALYENRQTFDLTRLNVGNKAAHVEEMWFRGVHSDIGGGNGNVKLSNITLSWMLEKAQQCGLPISAAALAKYTEQDATVALGENFDPIKNDDRCVFASDTIHETATGKELNIGDSKTFTVGSAEKYSWSEVKLEAGAHYSFSVDDDQKWEDADMVCSAAGWKSDELNWLKREAVELFEGKRRCPEADWFELIGSLDEGADIFRIGCGGDNATYTPRKNGTLYAFANDLKIMYFNNHGEIKVNIKRVANPAVRQLSYTVGADG